MARVVPAWLLSLLACPRPGCGGRLAVAEGRRARGAASRAGSGPGAAASGALTCRTCGMLYPVLAGVPVVVPAPHIYCAGYREAVVTALAEVGALDRAALAVIDAFAASAPGSEATRFGDDWTAADAGARWPRRAGRAMAGFDRFVAAARPLEERLAALAPRSIGTALDLGCGDGELGRRLTARARRLVVADLSLRAVLRARARCGGRAAGVVLDADEPALAAAAFDAIATANLIDLLERPTALPAALATALRPGGRLIVSTPDPELGGGDDGAAAAAIERAELTIERVVDGLPWLRLHPPRHAQVYVCQAIVARRPSGRLV